MVLRIFLYVDHTSLSMSMSIDYPVRDLLERVWVKCNLDDFEHEYNNNFSDNFWLQCHMYCNTRIMVAKMLNLPIALLSESILSMS